VPQIPLLLDLKGKGWYHYGGSAIGEVGEEGGTQDNSAKHSGGDVKEPGVKKEREREESAAVRV